ncbi:hypothetical protein BC629DRAFT_1437287 [Irpex lacteus]|nr:hypothetical protein BC629DRAFT_1437287 [Irpex lacteus]
MYDVRKRMHVRGNSEELARLSEEMTRISRTRRVSDIECMQWKGCKESVSLAWTNWRAEQSDGSKRNITSSSELDKAYQQLPGPRKRSPASEHISMGDVDAPRRTASLAQYSSVRTTERVTTCKPIDHKIRRSDVQGRQVNGAKAPVVAARCTCLHDGRQGLGRRIGGGGTGGPTSGWDVGECCGNPSDPEKATVVDGWA